MRLVSIHRSTSALCALIAVGAAQAQLAKGSTTSVVATGGPCDIYQAGGTPCVAAYSTVRALYGSYNGNLYQVRRSDGTTKDIGMLSAGYVANAATQDAFCTGTACRISIIYDQSGNGNNLTKAPAGSPDFGMYNDSEAVADSLPIKLDGHKVYGLHVTPGGWKTPGQVGYRNTKTNGVVQGDNPETMYMVADGAYVNGSCCFDFGNTEMISTVYGDMESIYFGTNNWWDKGVGNGPWVMSDLENGVYNMGGPGNMSAYGDKNGNTTNDKSVSFSYPFATAYLKGNSATATNGGPFTLKGGDAQSGALTTVWDGQFPVGYSPRNRQGGVGLGVGGDNSSGAQGNFYEGVMTAGFASTATDDAVQANIVAAGYGRSTTIVVTIPAHRDSVFNGAFDLGTLGWTFNTWEGGAHGSVVNGEYQIQIDSVGQHNSGIQLVQNGIILERGKSYEVKFDAYASSNRTLEANVEQDVNPWVSYLPALQNFNLTTIKTTYSYAFTMTNPTDSNGRVSFNVGASTQTVFLDNIAVKAISTSIHPTNDLRASSAVIRLDHSRLQVEFPALQGLAISVGIFDLNGKQVRSDAFRARSGQVQLWTSDLSGLPRGVYVLGIQAGGMGIHCSKLLYGD